MTAEPVCRGRIAAIRRHQIAIARDRGDRCAELILTSRSVACATPGCLQPALPHAALCGGCWDRLVNGHVQRPERRALPRWGR